MLSPRERQILTMLAEGHSNKELAARVLVAESTIETYFTASTPSSVPATARRPSLGIL